MLGNKFTFGRHTGIFESCSVVYKGKMMIFGGAHWDNYVRQISEISQNGNCGLRRLENVAMLQDFSHGACNVIKENKTEAVILCFAESHGNDCYR